MKNFILFLVVAVAAVPFLAAAPQAQATFDLPDFNVCDYVPVLCEEPDIDTNVTVNVTPSIEPSVEPSVEPTVEVTVTPVEPTATPSAAPTTTSSGTGQGDGLSDGRSDGLCSKPPCVPAGPPATGRAK